jgi:hypothetical protein
MQDGTPPCVSCGAAPGSGPYCAACGEKRVLDGDHSLHHFLAAAFEAVTDLDLNVVRSLRALVAQPGLLTVEYMRGRRKPYVAPLRLFLLVNLLFFVVQSVLPSYVFTTPLRLHLASFYGGLASRAVARVTAARGISVADYARQFDPAVATNAKSLVIVMVPALSLVLLLLFARARRFYVEHLASSLHFYAFFLLLLIGVSGLTRLAARLFGAQPGALAAGRAELAVTAIVMLAVAAYFAAALRRVYGGGRALAAVRAATLSVCVIAILHGYRFVLFFATLWSLQLG